MTANERLFTLRLMDAWKEAASARNRPAMIALMLKAEVIPPESTVDALLANPSEYGF